MRKLRALLFYGLVISVVALLLSWVVLKNPPYIQAIATVLLVAVTAVYVALIYGSIVQTSNLRKEDRDIDFKRRKLDWIVNWARGVRQILVRDMLRHNIRMELESSAVENEEIINTAKIFGAKFERIVEQAAKDLWAFIKALEKPAVNYDLYFRGLNQSFSNVLKSALKVEGDLVKTNRSPGGTGTK